MDTSCTDRDASTACELSEVLRSTLGTVLDVYAQSLN